MNFKLLIILAIIYEIYARPYRFPPDNLHAVIFNDEKCFVFGRCEEIFCNCKYQVSSDKYYWWVYWLGDYYFYYLGIIEDYLTIQGNTPFNWFQ